MPLLLLLKAINLVIKYSGLAESAPLLILLYFIIFGIFIFIMYRVLRKLARSYLRLKFIELMKTGGASIAIKIIAKDIKSNLIHLLKNMITTPEIFKGRYWVEDNAEIVLYKYNLDSSSPLASYQPQVSVKLNNNYPSSLKVSLIATLRNEGKNVRAWVKSVFEQTHLPDEIIITDGGSTDETLSLLKEASRESPVPFHILVEPEANIARGRNIAIDKAQFNKIATTDFGCRLQPDWLEKILTPFETDDNIDVVAGMYRAVDRKGKNLERMAWWTNESLKDPRWFLPSGRSSAFTKDIWMKVGGYPEWLTMTGEDTFFAMELRKYAKKWAIVPEAVAEWHAPDTALSYWQKIYTWSVGEGESGLNAPLLWKFTLQILSILLLSLLVIFLQAAIWIFPVLTRLEILVYLTLTAWFVFFIVFSIKLKGHIIRLPLEIGGRVARIFGYIHGARRRHQVELKRNELVKGTIFILSGIPIDDTGGGARCTQIALEFLRRKYAVVFINKYPKYESFQLNLSIQDTYLYTYQVSKLDWDRFCRDEGWLLDKRIIGALIEMPLSDFIPIINKVKDTGGVIIYDLLDDWDTQLGGNWYSEEIEAKIIMSSQVFVATAPILVEHLSHKTQKKVELLPNAVNTHLFNPDRFYERPSDLPRSKWTIIYVGALWGEWFDWNLLTAVAFKYPEASVVVIGDYKGQCPTKLTNLFFLGLKPQKVLPAYLAFSDVAIIPWKVNNITQATNPLKVYEYLAMKKPVVAPEINPLKGIPGVYLAQDTSDFLDLVGEIRKTALPTELISEFIKHNNWQARIDRLINLLSKSSGVT